MNEKTPTTNTLESFLNRQKGEICNEFEKVCPTDTSLKRVIKTAHDVFDEIRDYVNKNYQPKG